MSQQAKSLYADEGVEIALIKRVVHPEFGEVIELPGGQLAVPVEACTALVQQQHEELSEALADVEDQVHALQSEVDEARSQHAHVMGSLPEGTPFGDAHKRHLQHEVERGVAQLNHAHGVLAGLMESVGGLVDQLSDGVAVVVSENNEHGKGILNAMQSLDDYAEAHIPEVEFA